MSDKLTQQLERMESTYADYSKEFARDGKITPDEAATLKSVSTKLEALRKRAGEYKDQKAGAPGQPKPKQPKGVVTEGEVSIVKQVALGKLIWGGKFRGQLWGITGKDGAIVRSGSGLSKDMANMNGLGARALQAIAGLDALQKQWNADNDVVRKALTQAQADVKKLQSALPAMRQRMKNDSDFFGDVNGYVSALEAAEKVVGDIRVAEKEFVKATHELQKAVFEQQAGDAADKKEEVEGELAQLKADIEQAKAIFKEIVDIVDKLRKADFEGLALKAINFVGEKMIEAHYEPKLQELTQKLAAVKAELKLLKSKALIEGIEAARAGLEAKAIALQNAQKSFQTALAQVARLQANAQNELKESPSTAIAAQMIAQRVKQLQSVAAARNTCGRYLRDSAAVAVNMMKIGDQYGRVGDFLDSAAKADPAYRRETPYAKMLELSARQNVVKLDEWRNFVSFVQGDCRTALTFAEDQGPKGPMGPLDQAIVLVKQGLTNPS